jgi:hypothetical protein
MHTNIIFVTGLWILPGNPKRTEWHYMRLLPESLRLIRGHTLIFFYSQQDILDHLTYLCRENEIHLLPRKTPISDLPHFSFGRRALEACRKIERDEAVKSLFIRPGFKFPMNEKGLGHFIKHYMVTNGETYQSLLAIWLSKIGLVLRAIDTVETTGPHNTEEIHFAWIDASISRFNGKRKNWDIRRIGPKADKLSHYRSMTMAFEGRPLPLNASFMLAHKSHWSKITEAYNDSIERHIDVLYPHDEETILSYCVKTHPQYFESVDM